MGPARWCLLSLLIIGTPSELESLKVWAHSAAARPGAPYWVQLDGGTLLQLDGYIPLLGSRRGSGYLFDFRWGQPPLSHRLASLAGVSVASSWTSSSHCGIVGSRSWCLFAFVLLPTDVDSSMVPDSGFTADDDQTALPAGCGDLPPHSYVVIPSTVDVVTA